MSSDGGISDAPPPAARPARPCRCHVHGAETETARVQSRRRTARYLRRTYRHYMQMCADAMHGEFGFSVLARMFRAGADADTYDRADRATLRCAAGLADEEAAAYDEAAEWYRIVLRVPQGSRNVRVQVAARAWREAEHVCRRVAYRQWRRDWLEMPEYASPYLGEVRNNFRFDVETRAGLLGAARRLIDERAAADEGGFLYDA